jgi:hypothetical protein
VLIEEDGQQQQPFQRPTDIVPERLHNSATKEKIPKRLHDSMTRERSVFMIQ